MKKNAKVTANPKAETKSVKKVAKKAASVEPKKKVAIKTKVSEDTKKAVEKIVTFQGVEQIFHIDTKVIKSLGLKLERYVKLDGTISSLYVLTGKDAKATKALHDYFNSGKLSKICHYWGYVHGYKVSEKNLKEFCKITGIKAA